jgi:recombination protein RecT
MSDLEKATPGAPATRPTTVKEMVNMDYVKQKFRDILGQNAAGFLASVANISNSPELKSCDPSTVLSAALVAASLNLPIDPNLGFSAIIAYNSRQKDGSYKKSAQFQVMYKGLIQLALRSGQVKTINVAKVHEGQLVERNLLTGEIAFDEKAKTSDKVVGYVAYIRLNNGFEKTLYSTVEEITAHGKRFSKTFAFDSSIWKKDFDAMASKTVLKMLISKYSPLSVDMMMVDAVRYDQGVVRSDENLEITGVEYPDNAEDATVIHENLEAKFNAPEAAEKPSEGAGEQPDLGEKPKANKKGDKLF